MIVLAENFVTYTVKVESLIGGLWMSHGVALTYEGDDRVFFQAVSKSVLSYATEEGKIKRVHGDGMIETHVAYERQVGVVADVTVHQDDD